ncbi:MAG: hypothetical protein K0R00_204 [Herbinix sp.]|jgi:hypothetical protein|nr:hypothetical protein [Herbinix sp.]
MITSNGQRLAKALVKVSKNVVIVAGSAIITGVLTKKTRDAVGEIGEGAKHIYNVVVNIIQK